MNTRLLNAAKSIRDNWTKNLTPYMAELNAAIAEVEYRKGTLEHRLDAMLQDVGDLEECLLEVDCTAFATIRKGE